ncbi:MAG: glycosyltransferase family 9 protein [Nitrospinae bacterium]|nr:glycosyltransferase family 9 protein [Nitrospinota bacterium]
MAERILIMSLTRMGDLVQATPLISGMRQKYPDSVITLMVSSDFESFIPNIPDIDNSIVLDIRQFKKREREQDLSWVVIYQYLESFLEEVKAQRFDLVVNLSHSKLSALMILYLGIKKVCGFLCNETGDRMTEHPWMQYFGIEPFNRNYNPFNLVEIFTRSADVRPEDQRIRINVPEEPLSLIAPDLSREAIRDDELVIGIQAGSSIEGRRWPASHFAELADSLADGLNARIVLFGVESEAPIAGEICRLATRSEKIINLTGKTNIPKLIAWVGRCRYLVTNDTGTMHIAAALGTTIVGLFFAHAHPYETGPYSPGHVLFQARISCAPCSYGVQCNNIVCIHKVKPHHLYSMIQAHINAGGWNLTDDMGPLDEVNIYETRYGNDQRLTLKPLTRHPIKLDDVFRWAYSSLWLESLGEYDHCDNSRDEAAMVELMWQDYDCGGIDEIVEPLRYKIEVVKDLIKLSREGTKATTSLIKMLHSRPSSKKMQALGDKISGIDETLNQTGCAHPEIKPVIDLFVKRKENFQGDDVVRLGKDTLRCYEQMRKEFTRLILLLNAAEESFAPGVIDKNQVGFDSINALVPGR